ncbi:unnamed protein product [Owenia fusiformis]|uniref:LysM domain-containing protein n=1 Tax=Owenia fusiformis TaxID=6347 RepID=A0A8S4PVA9_OWEFU|nr:unnamed protein product [Owenia fusiformis]
MTTSYISPISNKIQQKYGSKILSTDAEIQNCKSTNVYIFGSSDVDEAELKDNIMEMTEMRSRGNSSGKRSSTHVTVEEEPVFLERNVNEGDTIQSIALQYGCPVSELKRLNNLIQDQDFFAKKVIKVPIKRHGLLTELIEKENKENKNSKIRLNPNSGAVGGEPFVSVEDDYADQSDNSDSEGRGLLVRTLSIRDSLGTQSREAHDFLKAMDKDLLKIQNSTKTQKDTLQEVTTALTCKRIQPLKKADGADCGMRWWTIVGVMFLIGLVTPLAYFLYIEYGKA